MIIPGTEHWSLEERLRYNTSIARVTCTNDSNTSWLHWPWGSQPYSVSRSMLKLLEQPQWHCAPAFIYYYIDSHIEKADYLACLTSPSKYIRKAKIYFTEHPNYAEEHILEWIAMLKKEIAEVPNRTSSPQQWACAWSQKHIERLLNYYETKASTMDLSHACDLDTDPREHTSCAV